MPWCACDLDDLLAYKTVKTVTVRHRWLGGIYYVSMLAIIVYTIVWNVVIKRGYEVQIPVAGAVRSSIKAPNKTAFPNATELPYCAPKSAHPAPGQYAPTLPCVYPDMESGSLSVVTPGDDGALLVGTRLSTTMQFRDSCAPTDFVCDPWKNHSAKQSFYVAAVENCTLVVQHAVSRAVQHQYAGAGDPSDYIFDSFRKDRPPAKILGPKIWNNRSKSFEDGRMLYVEPQPYGDQMTIADLLWVAGVDLNVEYPDRQNPENRSSERYDGQTIRVRVRYEGSLTLTNLNPDCERDPDRDPGARPLRGAAHVVGPRREVLVPGRHQ